jgi:hypothetical protein
MSATKFFFIALYAVMALVGLFAAAAANDYLQFFGFALFLFGIGCAFATVKRHFDEAHVH